MDLLRQEVATGAHTIVLKVGTRVLTHADGALDEERITQLAEELSQVKDTGRNVILVSSGAVGAGIGILKLDKRPADISRLQAVAAVGQMRLMETYDRVFRKHGRHAAQVLLTAEDVENRTRYLNVRNTLLRLLEYGAIPIINENDTVSVAELMTTFGDNDRLAGLVTTLVRAPLLVIFSDVDGLYDGDPRAPESKLIPTVSHFDETIDSYVRDKLTGLSKGGMASKIKAARMVTAAGENVIIASGRQPGLLKQIVAGENVGTLFVAQGKTASPFKRWLGFSARPRGKLSIDAGAQQALVDKGRSLLAIGVTKVEGTFIKGDLVSLCDGEGREIARGLTNYSSDEIERIRGLKSDRIAQVLGHRPYEEVVHRDNLALV
jgi:glutamate 5-kinase